METPDIDPATVARARSGDADARERLYRALGSAVYTLARRMLASASLAEDVLQETFVEVFTKLDGLRCDANIRAWVRRIAVNKCLTHQRSPWVARRVDWDAQDMASVPAPERALRDADRLARALDALPPAARAVVWLHDVEGYTHEEIGRLMGRTTSFSKTRLARAHGRLRALLADEPEEPDEADDGAERICVNALKIC